MGRSRQKLPDLRWSNHGGNEEYWGQIYTGIQSTVPITPSMGSRKATSGKPPDIEGILRQLISRVENSDPAFQSAIPDTGMGQPGNLSVSRIEGHGVSRCPRIYIDFPLLLYGLVGRTPGWSVPGLLASTGPPGRIKRRDGFSLETTTDPGRGQPPGSVISVDSLTLVVVVWSRGPSERTRRLGPCPQQVSDNVVGLRITNLTQWRVTNRLNHHSV